jgi:hypothetical protein
MTRAASSPTAKRCEAAVRKGYTFTFRLCQNTAKYERFDVAAERTAVCPVHRKTPAVVNFLGEEMSAFRMAAIRLATAAAVPPLSSKAG